MAPKVIGIDLDYSEKKDEDGDNTLVSSCSKYKNICLGVSAVSDGGNPVRGFSAVHKSEEDSSAKSLQKDRAPGDGIAGGKEILQLRQPFDGLAETVTAGLINNTRNSKDGYVRNALFDITVDDTRMDGFAIAIYKMYMDSDGKEYVLPRLDDDNSFNFIYSRKGHEYTRYSFADVAEGKISSEAFRDCIVLVGDYTDEDNTFNAPNQRNIQMREVELQANILEALLSKRTGQKASKLPTAVFYAIFMALFFIGTSYSSDRQTAVFSLLLNVLQLLCYWAFTYLGYYVNILVPVIMVVVIMLYNLIVRYVIAIQNQYAMEDVFKKYVDESVISELGKSGLIEAHIGVESRDIAVLFVDIRGFTSLSESLPLEQIVEILNDYLALVAEAVSKYQGTLDKFIGDMVNTASRLEGAAAPGQILISEEMAHRLEGRIQAVFAGEYELKGKKGAVPAYAVEKLA